MKCLLTHRKLFTETANFLENSAVLEDFSTVYSYTASLANDIIAIGGVNTPNGDVSNSNGDEKVGFGATFTALLFRSFIVSGDADSGVFANLYTQ
jgi:hypothetical protein